jgi:t-SNARE complex subunit (syntaxin)
MEEIQELIDEDGYKVITAIKEVADRSGMAVGTLQQYYYRLREAKKIQGIDV